MQLRGYRYPGDGGEDHAEEQNSPIVCTSSFCTHDEGSMESSPSQSRYGLPSHVSMVRPKQSNADDSKVTSR